MPINDRPPGDDPPFLWALCQPCWDADHDSCAAAVAWCECLTELLVEAEERP